jgi:hypothetical protein
VILLSGEANGKRAGEAMQRGALAVLDKRAMENLRRWVTQALEHTLAPAPAPRARSRSPSGSTDRPPALVPGRASTSADDLPCRGRPLLDDTPSDIT